MPWQAGMTAPLPNAGNQFAGVAAQRTMQNQLPTSIPYGMGVTTAVTTINPGQGFQVGMAANSLL
jgi:hypothetical protein